MKKAEDERNQAEKKAEAALRYVVQVNECHKSRHALSCLIEEQTSTQVSRTPGALRIEISRIFIRIHTP